MSPKTDLIDRLEQRAAICILQTDAADLRAAAAAVRLVAECREALVKAKRTSKGWYEHTTEALAAIAEWEGKL